jgi:antitoxin ParD1/3/4
MKEVPKMPTATMNISLPENMKEFVETQAREQGFGTLSEYMRTVIRQLQNDKKRAKVDALLLEGLNSGPAKPMTAKDWDDIKSEVRGRHVRRTKQGKQQR